MTTVSTNGGCIQDASMHQSSKILCDEATKQAEKKPGNLNEMARENILPARKHVKQGMDSLNQESSETTD
jgi:hypothetical protein